MSAVNIIIFSLTVAFLSGYCDCKKSYKPVSDSAAKVSN